MVDADRGKLLREMSKIGIVQALEEAGKGVAPAFLKAKKRRTSRD
jgi:hypothetical protein